ncbi:DUF4058 family protein [Scytonema sp. NUACC26]|uniref:DUF4058 family protein n=1 Tax=Scytonema sp. NUACC26 TaxID=3140176 RepID=UPI0034DC4C9E
MSSPFAGMNPYLEHPDLWPGVHGRLIVAIADFLSPQLRPKYFVAIEERIYQTTDDDRLLVGIPDIVVQRPQTGINPTMLNTAVAAPAVKPAIVEIPMPETVKERYLEVRKVDTKEVVTAIEVLSPKNKRAGEGRNTYESKRQRVFGSSTHLVEIDLLRAGETMTTMGSRIQSDYRILVSRAEARPKADLYAFNLQNTIPSFPLPLRSEDAEPVIDLQTLLNELYDRASYDLVIDYSLEPVPPLSEANAIWNDAWLQQQGLR